MEVVKFWQIIETSRQRSLGNKHHQLEILEQILMELSFEEIKSFDAIFCIFQSKAHQDYLYEAATIINRGNSSDCFSYFIAWLIAQGQEIYQEALRNPETLADVVKEGEECQFESIMYVAVEIYERKACKKLQEERTFYDEMHKPLTIEINLPSYHFSPPYHFPKLEKKFGSLSEIF